MYFNRHPLVNFCVPLKIVILKTRHALFLIKPNSIALPPRTSHTHMVATEMIGVLLGVDRVASFGR